MVKTNTTSISTKKNAATAKAAVDPTKRAESVARRSMNQNVEIEEGIAMPTRDHKSKYPFADLKAVGQSFFLVDCLPGNAAAVKTTAKNKFNMRLIAKPATKQAEDGTILNGYRFWLSEKITPVDQAALDAAVGVETSTAESEAVSA